MANGIGLNEMEATERLLRIAAGFMRIHMADDDADMCFGAADVIARAAFRQKGLEQEIEKLQAEGREAQADMRMLRELLHAARD